MRPPQLDLPARRRRSQRRDHDRSVLSSTDRLAQTDKRHHLRPHEMSVLARFLIALVRAYQVAISPWLGKVCRFEPSCSRYAVACLHDHGALRGSLLSVKRLCKCHPFHPGGFDPPPPARIRHADEAHEAA